MTRIVAKIALNGYWQVVYDDTGKTDYARANRYKVVYKYYHGGGWKAKVFDRYADPGSAIRYILDRIGA